MKDPSDDEIWKIENSFRWGVPLHEGLALGFQALVPVKWQESAGDDLSGIGDFEMRTGLVGRISPALRWGFGLNAVFDTAAEPGLERLLAGTGERAAGPARSAVDAGRRRRRGA